MSPRQLKALRVVAAVLLGGAVVTGCGARSTSLLPAPNELTLPTSTSGSETPTSTTSSAAPSSTSSPSSTKRAGTTPKPPPAPQPAGGGRCAGFPGAACTGVPAGTALKVQGGNLYVTQAGAVVDGVHVTGDLVVRAPNVLIRNSQIDGIVVNFDDRTNVEGAFPFTIRDSMVGSETCTNGGPAIGTGNMTVERVHIRGFSDGIRAGGPNVVVRDSFIKLCSTDPSTHADGIQDYPASGNLVFDHNTVDLCGGRVPTDGRCDLKAGYNSPIFIHSNAGGGTKGARITNNLIMGGVYSIFLMPQSGPAWIVTGNRVVNGTWAYGAAQIDGSCGEIDQWSDNTTVTINSSYGITGTVSTIGCPA
jgi:hypothetical protein